MQQIFRLRLLTPTPAVLKNRLRLPTPTPPVLKNRLRLPTPTPAVLKTDSDSRLRLQLKTCDSTDSDSRLRLRLHNPADKQTFDGQTSDTRTDKQTGECVNDTRQIWCLLPFFKRQKAIIPIKALWLATEFVVIRPWFGELLLFCLTTFFFRDTLYCYSN